MVVDTGIEPVTPSMSRKCATAAPIDRVFLVFLEVETGFEPVVLQLCRLLLWAAQPLHQALRLAPAEAINAPDRLRADDEIRTRDPHLGKVMLYQLSHIRVVLLRALVIHYPSFRLRANCHSGVSGEHKLATHHGHQQHRPRQSPGIPACLRVGNPAVSCSPGLAGSWHLLDCHGGCKQDQQGPGQGAHQDHRLDRGHRWRHSRHLVRTLYPAGRQVGPKREKPAEPERFGGLLNSGQLPYRSVRPQLQRGSVSL